MKPPSNPMIPALLTWSELPGGKRYELWHTPQVKNARYHVIFLIGGTEVGKHAHDNEIVARNDFERRVEGHTT